VLAAAAAAWVAMTWSDHILWCGGYWIVLNFWY